LWESAVVEGFSEDWRSSLKPMLDRNGDKEAEQIFINKVLERYKIKDTDVNERKKAERQEKPDEQDAETKVMMVMASVFPEATSSDDDKNWDSRTHILQVEIILDKGRLLK